MTTSAPGSGRLADRADFRDLLGIVAAEVGLLPAWIEKDYWLVRVLEAVARSPGLSGLFVFKGGTSLSKAWKLIDRFSEDVDLLLTGEHYGPMPAKKGAREKTFKAVRQAIEKATPLRLSLEGLSEEEKRFYYLRADTHGQLRYPIRGGSLEATAGSQEWVLVEAGFRGGSNPWSMVPIRSYVGEYISGKQHLASLAAEYVADVSPVDVPVLAAERTFIEKLLAVHTAAVGSVSSLQARHYYDLSKLLYHSDVIRCLNQPQEFREILSEAVGVSNAHWGTRLDPGTLDLSASPALTLGREVLDALTRRWPSEETLYPRGQPPLRDVLREIAQLREQLQRIAAG